MTSKSNQYVINWLIKKGLNKSDIYDLQNFVSFHPDRYNDIILDMNELKHLGVKVQYHEGYDSNSRYIRIGKRFIHD